MKRLLRWLIAGLLAALALVLVALVFKDHLLTRFARQRIEALTGMPTELRRAHLGLGSLEFALEGLRLRNPPEFGGGIFLDLPELRVAASAAALREGRLHCQLVRLNLAALNIVEATNGVRNIDRFKPPPPPRRKLPAPAPEKADSPTPAASGTPDATAARPPGKAEPTKAIPPGKPDSTPARAPGQSGPTPAPRRLAFSGIDTLHLTLGRVRFTRLKEPLARRELVLDIRDLELKDVRTTADLSAVLFALALKNSATLLTGDWLAPLRLWRRFTGSLEAPGAAPAPAPPVTGPLPPASRT